MYSVNMYCIIYNHNCVGTCDAVHVTYIPGYVHSMSVADIHFLDIRFDSRKCY
jgi:hypothetical protein